MPNLQKEDIECSWYPKSHEIAIAYLTVDDVTYSESYCLQFIDNTEQRFNGGLEKTI